MQFANLAKIDISQNLLKAPFFSVFLRFSRFFVCGGDCKNCSLWLFIGQYLQCMGAFGVFVKSAKNLLNSQRNERKKQRKQRNIYKPKDKKRKGTGIGVFS